MIPLTTLPSGTMNADEDFAEQARPGHGIPSQDPDPGAQVALESDEAQREVHSILTGGGRCSDIWSHRRRASWASRGCG
jgi:hypothetical protein